jgi:tetratricopeptide (TPR) repeat protein
MACANLCPNRACRLVLAVGVVIPFLAVPLKGQFGPLLNPLQGPQARSQEEFDAVLEIATESDPNRMLYEVDRFVEDYPKSDFLGVAFQFKMQACQRTGQFICLLESGEKALKLQPDNLNVLITLASAIPDGAAQRADRSELLRRADDYAHRAINRLGTVHISHEISLDRWRILRGEMEAKAHEALGRVAASGGDLRTALTELELAAYKNPTPQGLQFFLLGVTYRRAGKSEEARTALLRAVELGPDQIRQLASNELQKITRGTPPDGKSD